jgi:hypothetical protein
MYISESNIILKAMEKRREAKIGSSKFKRP